MIWSKPQQFALKVAVCVFVMVAVSACRVSYKFTGTSIDYNVVKTIQIDNIPLRSAYVWAPMGPMFNNRLQDLYANQTRLQFVRRGGDLHISGEIIGYEQYNKSISADGLSSQTQLKMTVNIRFVNNTDHKQDFERQFTATTQYDSNQQLANVQEDLVSEMVDDLTDQIFNATVANW